MRHQPTARTSGAYAFPRTAEEFVQYLETLFPEPCPSPGEAHADLTFRLGQRDAVLKVRAAFNAASKKD